MVVPAHEAGKWRGRGLHEVPEYVDGLQRHVFSIKFLAEVQLVHFAPQNVFPDGRYGAEVVGLG